MPDGTRRRSRHDRRHARLQAPVPPLPHRAGVSRTVSRRSARRRAWPTSARRSTPGAQHISFGDPDFFNGPTHARRLVERLRREHPGVSYDVTIKVEHLLRHADLLPVLRETGCLFVTSAVESVDDAVLARLCERDTRARTSCAPWHSAARPGCRWRRRSCRSLRGRRSRDIVDLLGRCSTLDLVERGRAHPARHPAARDRGVGAAGAARDPRRWSSRSTRNRSRWPWRHADARVDALQREVMRIASDRSLDAREDAFAAIAAAAGLRRLLSAPAPTSRAGRARGRRHLHDRGVVLLRRARSRTARDGVMRVLLVATTTGYQIRSFGEAAARAGVDLTLASDRCDHLDDPWRDGAVPVRFHETEASVNDVVGALRDDPPVGVLAVGDRPAVLAASIAAAFRLPGHSARGGRGQPEQVLSRRAFDPAGLPTPAFRSSPSRPMALQLAEPVGVSRGGEAAGALGKPGRDSRRHAGAVSRRLRPAWRILCSAPTSARSATPRTTMCWSSRSCPDAKSPSKDC